jgi:CHASE2 domain-containing sensor protein
MQTALVSANKYNETWHHIIIAVSEWFGLFILLFCNVLGISAIIQEKPYRLIPWLVVYIIGILSSYIGSFLIFFAQDKDSHFQWHGFVPLILGIVFHVCWSFIRNTFNEMKKEAILAQTNSTLEMV